ncbi:MFS transporter [Candidatus Fukatsuia symbiotica]|uniref:MFS transporter n=1 Tax=Candidatus Fukatsuia symbiotica TaxID=1878942 RepID=A0A2U8I363_9GAMM|nr:MFS transporter [Candidatus Fukatsuia symbiotica]AWK13562.1 MFS transporter [Candidatus Fukatsuia symbiotica]MEA9445355.1 MFS transporter [Candidatus Fukatsuia symbiotica]
MLTWKQRLGVVAGNACEFYDIALFAAISGYITVEFQQAGMGNSTYIVWGIFALRFLIRPLGGYIIGLYADHYGRKAALILTSTVIGLSTLTMAVLPISKLGAAAPLLFLILQMLQAFSFGGEYPTIIHYLLSESEQKQRAKISSMIVASSLVGVLMSLLIVYFINNLLSPEEMQQIGWRIPLLIALVNIAISFYFRQKLKEISPCVIKNQGITLLAVLKIFLIVIPGAVVFYVQNLASTLSKRALDNGTLQTLYPLLSSSLLLVFVLFIGWLTDKYSTPQKIFRLGIYALLIAAAPLYLLLASKSVVLVIIAQLALTLIAALILSNLAAVLFEKSANKTAILGLGYNAALSVFGGLSPLIIALLIPFGGLFPGIYVAASGVAFVVAGYIPAIRKSTCCTK